MPDEPHTKHDCGTNKAMLDYACPRTPKPDAVGRLVVGLLITFIALAAGFFAIVIYMSRVG
jgi:hypothetical protein